MTYYGARELAESLRTVGRNTLGIAEDIQFPGDPATSRSRFEMILSTKEHEMHHRGQMMLIERLLGIMPHLTRERQARMQARR